MNSLFNHVYSWDDIVFMLQFLWGLLDCLLATQLSIIKYYFTDAWAQQFAVLLSFCPVGWTNAN